MRIISLPDYQQHFGLVISSEGKIDEDKSRNGLTALIRRIIISSPFITRRDLNQRILDILQPLKVNGDIKKTITEGLTLLQSMNEIVELHRDGQSSVFVTMRPCWIKLDDRNAVLLGDVDDSLLPSQPIDNYDIVRRFVPDEDNTRTLFDNDVEEISVADWFLRSCSGKICEGAEICRLAELQPVLHDLWDEKMELLLSESAGILDNNILFVGGKTGDFFGRYTIPSGRWRRLSEKIPDGVYFGVRPREYGESTLLLLAKQGDSVKVLPLYNRDQWRWLLWTNSNEADRVVMKEDQICITVPIPLPLENLLRLFASRQPEWGQWKTSIDVSIVDTNFFEKTLLPLPVLDF